MRETSRRTYEVLGILVSSPQALLQVQHFCLDISQMKGFTLGLRQNRWSWRVSSKLVVEYLFATYDPEKS